MMWRAFCAAPGRPAGDGSGGAVIEPGLGDPHGALFGGRKALGASGTAVPDPFALDGVEAESGAARGTGSPAAGRVGMSDGGEVTKLFATRQPEGCRCHRAWKLSYPGGDPGEPCRT